MRATRMNKGERPGADDLSQGDLSLVITPGGLRTSDQIAQVTPGDVVRPPRRRRGSGGTDKGPWLSNRARANWIVAAVRQGGEVQEFTADLVVPAEPSRNDGQLLYVFTGLQDEPTTMILQPVLQWGAAGDPPGWRLCSWLVDRQTGEARSTQTVAIASGTTVRAYIRREGKDGGRTVFTCGFEDHGATQMKVALSGTLRTAVAVLEAYRVKGSPNYPPDPAIRFQQVRLQQRQAGAWTVQDFVIEGGQHAEIVQVEEPSIFDLHCRF